MKIVVSRPFKRVRHLERDGRPACGAEAEGAEVVEDKKHVGCPDCALLGAVVGVLYDRRN